VLDDALGKYIGRSFAQIYVKQAPEALKIHLFSLHLLTKALCYACSIRRSIARNMATR
jgi:hypothetical protein